LRALTPEALQVLAAYSWPGNVRELKNLVERVIILTAEAEDGQPITAADLLSHLKDDSLSVRAAEEEALTSKPGSGRNLRDARQEFEKDFIVKTLRENDFNVSKCAQILGVERSHLHRKIKSFGIETKE
jgi:two-component system nitrogen regulation response regulator NtrX